MEKRAIFNGKLLPYALLLPQLAITALFFYWPASQAVWQSFLLQDAFGLSTTFVGLENYKTLFNDPDYYRTMVNTLVFSIALTVLSLSFSLLLAVQADKQLKGAMAYRTLLIWPYAVAPAVAGVLWLFMFQPSLGVLPQGLRAMGFEWNPLLNGTHALILVVNIVYAFFDTFGIIDTMTGGGPGKATQTLVYKVYSDGRLGGDLGGSAAQSVILMAIVIALTAVEFRYVGRRGGY